MILTSHMYVPSIRWRQGEYQALLRLGASEKNRIVPYIMIPEVEFDFELWQPKKSIQDHVHPFSARFKAKWGKRPAWVTVHPTIADGRMDDGRDIFAYVFEALRKFEARAVPAISLGVGAEILQSVRVIISTDNLGVAIAIRLEDLMKSDVKARIEDLARELDLALDEVDLVVDLGAPNYEPYDAFADALVAALPRVGNLHAFRNFVVIGTAIPMSFKDVARGSDQLPRHDWLFYKILIGKISADVRTPNFGDYSIVHPDFSPMDMRKIKSAGKLVYATPVAWEVRKGGAFRDNPEQMHGHCASIVSSGKFSGAGYSSGDDYIAKCADRMEGPSNLSRWKEVAINHHMTLVLDDLATLGGSALSA